VRTYVNLMLVMFLGGLWHGANWTFVLWGLWHGSWLALERMTGQSKATDLAGLVGTLLIVLLGWVMFRAENVTAAFAVYSGMLGLNGMVPGPEVMQMITREGLLFLVLGVAVTALEPRLNHIAATRLAPGPTGGLTTLNALAPAILMSALAVLTVMNLAESGLLSGGLTRDFDGIYKAALPHVAPSFGLIGVARYALLDEARQGALVGTDGWLFTAEETRGPPSEADLITIAALIRGIGDQLSQRGTDLVVVPLPAKIDVARAFSPDQVYGEALEGLHVRFSILVAGHGLNVVDARKALVLAGTPGFFPTDTHWTPVGAARVAAGVAQSGAVQIGDLAYGRIDGQAKALTGDLVAFVTSPGLAPYVGLAPESVVPVLQTPLTGDADIFGDAASDIVLVGTSYSANTDWGFADALMAELGRDVVSVAEQGRGPLAPMQDYLASSDFAAAPPAVVIWEIPVRYLSDPSLWKGTTAPAPGIASSLTGMNADG
jgi:alginate O-acetyltransferase complex protein AlgJ